MMLFNNDGNAFFIAAFELLAEMKNMGHKRCSYLSVLELARFFKHWIMSMNYLCTMIC